MKALILSCSTGEGHNSAAYALKEELDDKNILTNIIDPISFVSEKMKNNVSEGYNNLIRKAPKLFGVIYNLGKFYDNLNLPSPIYYLNKKYALDLFQYITENKYDFVISTHIFGMEALTAIRKIYNPDIKFYGILTDYTSIPFYKDTILDGYFITHNNVAEELVKKNIDNKKIYVTGIPVSKKFNTSISKKKAKRRLGIPLNKKLISITSGGAGAGKIYQLANRIDNNLDDKYLIYIFVGKNVKLKNKLINKFQDNKRIKIISFTKDINIYYIASDLVFSKPGGLSSTEIAVSNVLFVHLRAIPGCETANIKYFTKNGLSLKGRYNYTAVRAMKKLLNDDSLARNMLLNQKRLINKNSQELIINQILSEL